MAFSAASGISRFYFVSQLESDHLLRLLPNLSGLGHPTSPRLGDLTNTTTTGHPGMNVVHNMNRPLAAGPIPGPGSKACMNCAKVKCKCIYRQGGVGCERHVNTLLFILSSVFLLQ